MTFFAWLKGQSSRCDAVGDLARDAGQDPTFPREAGLRYRAYDEYLRERGAIDEALVALGRAWKEYQRCEAWGAP